MPKTKSAETRFRSETQRQRRTAVNDPARTPPDRRGFSQRRRLLRRGFMYSEWPIRKVVEREG